MRRVALVAVVGALAGCGGSGSAVAHVGGASITHDDLSAAVDHFRQEAAVEGREFPKKGADAYHTVERQALALLVYRAELLQSAKKLGVQVSESEVDSRLAQAGNEGGEGGVFARDTVRAQLAYEHLYTKVTTGVATEKKAAAMRRWLVKMKLSYEVSYEAGFGPAS